MAGRHAAKSNKKPAAVIIIVILVLGLIIGGVILFFNNMDREKNGTEVTTAPATSEATQATQQTEQATANTAQTAPSAEPQSTVQGHTAASAEETTVPDIAIPTAEGEQTSTFDATFIPNGEATDALTGESVSLREALGSSYSEGALTFNKDGTFTDTIFSSQVSTGKYIVHGDTLTATYSEDRNMDITVTSWNGGEPESFYVNYGGCIIYF